MKRSEDLLKEACTQLALEETEALLRSLDEKTLEQADALYQRHRKEIFSLLSHKKKKGTAWLRAAACIALVIGGAYWALSHQPPDSVFLAPVHTASLSPYFSASPTISPTFTFFASPIPTKSAKPSETFFVSPTPSPVPTHTPLPSPTLTPAPTAEPSRIPAGWTGIYFPQIPKGYELLSLESEENLLRAAYRAEDGHAMIFEEYASAEIIHMPENAQLSYVPLNGLIALQMKTETEITLVWEQEGRTLSLTAPASQALALAESVEKIPGK